MSFKATVSCGVLVSLIGTFLIAIHYFPHSLNESIGAPKFQVHDLDQSDASSTIRLTSECLPTKKPCIVELGNRKLKIEIENGSVRALEPISLLVESDDFGSDHFKAFVFRFEGRSMDMGKHILIPNKNKASRLPLGSSAQMYLSGMIPICSIDPNMQWQLVLEAMVIEKQVNERKVIEKRVHNTEDPETVTFDENLLNSEHLEVDQQVLPVRYVINWNIESETH